MQNPVKKNKKNMNMLKRGNKKNLTRFKQNILRKHRDDYDTDGGSELFTTTLTTNGLCYSFNGEKYSDVWKESEVTNTFNELFPHNNSAEFFQGAAVTDGEFLI